MLLQEDVVGELLTLAKSVAISGLHTYVVHTTEITLLQCNSLVDAVTSDSFLASSALLEFTFFSTCVKLFHVCIYIVISSIFIA